METRLQTVSAIVEELNSQPEAAWLRPLPELRGFTSLDLKSPRGRLLMGKAMAFDESDPNLLINTRLTITDVLIHPATKTDPITGEVKNLTRIAVFTVDGKVQSFFSKGIAKSLVTAAMVFGPPPWPNGISGMFRQYPVGDVQRWYQIDWDFESLNGE